MGTPSVEPTRRIDADSAKRAVPRHLSSRVAPLASVAGRRLAARYVELLAEGRLVLDLGRSDLDVPVPQPVLDSLMRLLKRGFVGLTPAAGLQVLRLRIAAHYGRGYGVNVPVDRIFLTPGATGASLLALAVSLNPGDEVLIGDPGYAPHRQQIELFHGRCVPIPLDATTAFQLNAELVERHWTSRTVGVVLVSPSNPVGTVIGADDLREIASVVRDRGGVMFADEVYHGLTFGDRATSVLEVAEDCFVAGSFSKYFNMAGFRLGWLIVPAAYVVHVAQLALSTFLGPATPSQFAALAAFDQESLAIMESQLASLRARRDYLVSALRDLGFRVPCVAHGGMFIYADCSALTRDSADFAREMLEQCGVLAAPGCEFGEHPDTGSYMGFSFSPTRDRLESAMAAMAAWLQSRRGAP